jgi:hypothetical protein
MPAGAGAVMIDGKMQDDATETGQGALISPGRRQGPGMGPGQP